jgi:hypothetical protein
MGMSPRRIGLTTTGRTGPRLTRCVLVALVAALAPNVAHAHVKWFTDPRPYPLRTDLILSDRTAIFLAVAAVALGLFTVASKLVSDPYWPRLPFLDHMAVGAPKLLAVQTAITLIHSGVTPALFVPNMPLGLEPLGLLLAGLQVAIAFSFITSIGDWIGALALLLLGPLAFFFFPFWDVLEQLLFAGIGLVMLVVGSSAVRVDDARPWFESRFSAAAPRAVAALRMLTGVSIIALALGEKIWNPDLGAAFMADHPQFNVFQTLRLANVSNDQFVLLAGLTEGTIGVLLVSGLLTRVVILFMWLPFNLGTPFLPSQELLGHLPVFAVMYLLLVHGAGIAPGESLRKPELET